MRQAASVNAILASVGFAGVHAEFDKVFVAAAATFFSDIHATGIFTWGSQTPDGFDLYYRRAMAPQPADQQSGAVGATGRRTASLGNRQLLAAAAIKAPNDELFHCVLDKLVVEYNSGNADWKPVVSY